MIPISATLYRPGDIGFSAGMIIADGSVMESLISSGSKRSRLDGGGRRLPRWYSMAQVQVSMEDKQSLVRLGMMWGARVTFCQKSSVGNDVWRVYVSGRRALDLLQIILPYLSGPKRRKAIYLLKKYKGKRTIPALDPERFKAFGGMR
jgi:hypothetical protein